MAFLASSPGLSSPEGSDKTNVSFPPTQLCKWSIHAVPEPYELTADEWATAQPELEPRSDSDPPRSLFVESLYQSMASNDFTTTPKSDLPLAQDMIVKSLEEDPSPLQLDAWKMAIMAGNGELLDQLYDDNKYTLPEGIESIHPFHLAAAFLDGGNRCCGIFATLSGIIPSSFAFSYNVDDLGHTILDALVVTVLRSHTRSHRILLVAGFIH